MRELMRQAKAKAARLARKAVAWVKPKFSALWAKSKAVGMSAVVALSLTLPALASEGGSGSSGSLVDVVAATGTITSMVATVWTTLMANPLLTVYVAAGLLGTGIGFFKSLRSAAHGG